MPTLKYKVTFAGRNMPLSFSEVSGLTRETHLSIKLGEEALAKSAPPGELAFQNGLGLCDNQVIEWIEAVKAKTVPISTATLQALDAKGAVVQQWTLKNAKPKRINCTTLKPGDKEIRVVELMIAHESIASGDGTRKGGGSHW